MRRFSASLSTYSLPETQSPSSSNEQIASGFRFSAERYSYFFRARFLVILLANTKNGDGLSLGMAFHKPKYVSFTHSSLSSWFSRILLAMRKKSFPHFEEVSVMASSFLSQYTPAVPESPQRYCCASRRGPPVSCLGS